MKVKLLHHTPLWIASTAIRKCWASEGKSDSELGYAQNVMGDVYRELICGEADKELIHRVGNKNKHASTLEHLNYSFDIDGISRACLQELARHRHASMSVKSTRYTLKELKDEEEFIVEFNHELEENFTSEQTLKIASKYIVLTGHRLDLANIMMLDDLREELVSNTSNDIAKYMLPEAYKTSLVWTINARSLQNFLALRTNKSALWEIQDLAREVFDKLPEEHKYLFEEFISEPKEA